MHENKIKNTDTYDNVVTDILYKKEETVYRAHKIIYIIITGHQSNSQGTSKEVLVFRPTQYKMMTLSIIHIPLWVLYQRL